MLEKEKKKRRREAEGSDEGDTEEEDDGQTPSQRSKRSRRDASQVSWEHGK